MMDSNNNIIIFGGLIIDDYIFVDRWPREGQDAFISEENSFVGGCSINMEVTVRNLMDSFENTSINVHSVSNIGEDRDGEIICQYMKEHNLSEELLFHGGGITGKCIVFVSPDGERTFLTKKGVEGVFTSHMEETIVKKGAKVAGVTGYYLLNDDSAKVVDCLKALKKAGTKILFDPGALVGEIPENLLDDLLEIADIITPNQGELDLMGGADLLEAYKEKGKTIFLKAGSKGGILYCEGKEMPYTAKRCESVDSTGAGDSFAGAILYAIAMDLSMEDALDLAIICAAKTVTLQGPHDFWRIENDR